MPTHLRRVKKPARATTAKKKPGWEVLRHNLRAFEVGKGLPPVSKMREELADMRDVLFGRKPPPIDFGIMNLHEIAEAYYSRASEMTMLIQEKEREGLIPKNHPMYKFRTGELRTFRELAKSAAELGSRRLTYENALAEAARYGRPSRMPLDWSL